MSGSREKARRRATGIGIKAKRDQAAFGRRVGAALEAKAAASRARSRERRFVFAVFGLLGVAAAIVALVAG